MSSYLDSLRRAKNAPVVAKTEFATFASGVPSDYAIFVFEGVDDKITYSQWLRLLKPGFNYESMIRKNKTAVLKLFDALKSDVTGLSRKARYFVDRDFDDLQGRDSSPFIFMTDKYSIENYFVCPDVVTEILKDDFHCNGFNEVRDAISQVFRDAFSEFLKATAALNFRIFLARKLNISIQAEGLPSRLNQFATISLHSSELIQISVADLVPLTREPSDAEIAEFRPLFDKMDPASRYRGKFALLFFIRWLTLLRNDRIADVPQLFHGIPKSEFKVRGDFCLETLVPRVPPPPNLQKFVCQTT